MAYAVMNRHTRLVAPKTLKQQEVCSLNAMRNLYIRQRNMMINHMRGTLKEYGIPSRKGARYFENNIDKLLAEQIENCSFPEKVAEGLLMQSLMLKIQREHITECEKQIAILSERDECKRLKTIPGVGNIVSTQLYGHGGSISHYKKGSDFAASLGLVPRQHSTGGKQIYGSISKRGNVSIRTNLIHGARSVLTAANKRRKTEKSSRNDLIEWGLQCCDRMGMNRASVALANKIARISWKVLKVPGEIFVLSMSQAA